MTKKDIDRLLMFIKDKLDSVFHVRNYTLRVVETEHYIRVILESDINFKLFKVKGHVNIDRREIRQKISNIDEVCLKLLASSFENYQLNVAEVLAPSKSFYVK